MTGKDEVSQPLAWDDLGDDALRKTETRIAAPRLGER